ncbi:hypothetical protein NIES4106_43180 [Fischerella sp. NIES-4106]|jgi:hypothetical protein|nr:hypothetical protein NIES4106_43180 [Fischerella sp. NIES-4106]
MKELRVRSHPNFCGENFIRKHQVSLRYTLKFCELPRVTDSCNLPPRHPPPQDAQIQFKAKPQLPAKADPFFQRLKILTEPY